MRSPVKIRVRRRDTDVTIRVGNESAIANSDRGEVSTGNVSIFSMHVFDA